MKKILALMVTLMLCLTVFTGFSASAFSDVTEEHVHMSAITYLAEKGVINGYEDGSFKPENTITRAEFVKMMLEFLGFGNVYGEAIVKTNFTDVDAKTMTVTTKNEAGEDVTTTNHSGQHWAAGYIKLAVDKGVVNGYGDGRFGPDDPVKYEEAIKMIVCCLGREEYAKTRADMIGKPLWPDGYLSIGNDLMVAKSTGYALGENASRSNVAQMLYNVKEVQVIIPPTVTVGGSSFGGGGGGGSIGSGSSNSSIGSSTTVVSGLTSYGKVVAAVKTVGSSTKQIMIDDDIVIDGEAVTKTQKKYIIVKLEEELEGEQYAEFYTNGEDLSSYIGHRVKIKYHYDPNATVSGRYEIENIESFETEVISINAGMILRENTIEKNEGASQAYLCWTDGDRNHDEPLYTDDLDTLTVIYNNKTVDVAALGDDPEVKSDVIMLSDLMPENGSVKIVNADEDGDIDVIWINAYETYVVGATKFNTTPRSIVDKFRKEDDGETPVELVFDDGESEIEHYITQDGEKKEIEDISEGQILSVAKSKCGKNIDITIGKTKKKSGLTYKTIRTDNTGTLVFELSNGTTYPINKYFTDYVAEGLDLEMGDGVDLYLNKSDEVIWLSIAEVTYNTGYLVRAIYTQADDQLTLEIMTGSKIETLKMADTNTRYITKATSCLSTVDAHSSNPNGNVYKNLGKDKIYDSLCENANIINYGDGDDETTEDNKPSVVLSHASTAQPIMYTKATDTTLSHLVTFEPDVANRFTGDSLTYEKLGSDEYQFYNEDRTIVAPKDATFVFVPNNRLAGATSYKMGKASAVKKFIEYMPYNIEPFFTTNASGVKRANMFVVYNESIDIVPNFHSENIIISEIIPGQTSDNTPKYTIKGYVGNTTKTYTVNGETPVKNAYVLNGNFERTNVTREIAVGDVIRVGYFASGNIVASIDIIFDISEEYREQAGKAFAIAEDGEILDIETLKKKDVFYYARIGEIITKDPSAVPTWCEIKVNDSLTSRVTVGTTFASKSIFIYDYTATDKSSTDKDDRLTKIEMGRLYASQDVENPTVVDLLFVWDGEEMANEQIYAVRYPIAQP